MIYQVYATWAEHGPMGWTPRRRVVGEIEAPTAAEAEAKAARDYADELAGKGIRVEARR